MEKPADSVAEHHIDTRPLSQTILSLNKQIIDMTCHQISLDILEDKENYHVPLNGNADEWRGAVVNEQMKLKEMLPGVIEEVEEFVKMLDEMDIGEDEDGDDNSDLEDEEEEEIEADEVMETMV